MRKRRVNKRWGEAVKQTTVPLKKSYFYVDSTVRYHAMAVMTRALPNLQQIDLHGPDEDEDEYKYSDGEDPEEELASETADRRTHDIEIISNFSKLRILEIYKAPLNGRYPVLFNSFPLLEKLNIEYCGYLKCDLEMLSGFPLLKQLFCVQNYDLTGNISSLRVLKGTLQNVTIDHCPRVEGNFMDLADFPRLKGLDLERTAVTGDIRDIGENDFSYLQKLILPEGVYGGKGYQGYQFQRIADGPDLIRSVYLLKKQRPTLKMEGSNGKLSEDSPDWYEARHVYFSPPFYIYFVKAGCRFGYRWENEEGNQCEVNWLDPEPNRESNNYGEYIEQMQEIDSEVKFYKGFHQPPTEEEYNRLCERLEEEGEWW